MMDPVLAGFLIALPALWLAANGTIWEWVAEKILDRRAAKH